MACAGGLGFNAPRKWNALVVLCVIEETQADPRKGEDMM